MSDRDAASTWPFWAPSQLDSVEAALDLADVGPGTDFIDLGCGDGQVVAAAAARGARARGVEFDADLVSEAAANLRAAGHDSATVIRGDLFDDSLDLSADVAFSYLAPATLQRLLPRLQAQSGCRLVSVDFDVPNLVPTRRSGAARMYRMPGRRARRPAPGWPAAGTLVAASADTQSLCCLSAGHPGGRVQVTASRPLGRTATLFVGARHLPAPSQLAIDLRWEPTAAGTFAGGPIRVSGIEAHPMFVVFGDDEPAQWDLDVSSCEILAAALRRRVDRPTTIAEVLQLIGS